MSPVQDRHRRRDAGGSDASSAGRRVWRVDVALSTSSRAPRLHSAARRAATFAVLSLVGCGGGADTTTAPQVTTPPRLEIVFGYSSVTTGDGLFLMSADGKSVRPYITGGNDSDPRWSPDGRSLLYTHVTTGTSQTALWSAAVDD